MKAKENEEEQQRLNDRINPQDYEKDSEEISASYYSCLLRVIGARRSACLFLPLSFCVRLQNFERAFERLIYLKKSCAVIEFSTVVRSAEHCHALPACEELVSIFHDLMSSANQVYVQLLADFLHSLRIETDAHSAHIRSPFCPPSLRVRPEEVCEKA